MSRSLFRILAALVFCAIAVPSLAQAPALSISRAKTADSLQRGRNLCRDFTNNVLQIMTAAASLGRAKLYKGCAVLPLNADDTGKLIEQIRGGPQHADAYASGAAARAAEYFWPCK
jgi:hypothetical protein